ncbi:MAG TPA: matrixin family metalloprotease [Casimicrobiaceae bacterium]|nr:matrixin family metalloprotease [Casimicrobiaceae bacterium]
MKSLRKLPLAALAAAIVLASNAFAEIPDYEFERLPRNAADAARPTPKYRFLFGLPVGWKGPIFWKYNPANALEPWASDPVGTIAKIRDALESWQPHCGVSHVYEGETSIAPNTRVLDPIDGLQPDYENVVGWGDLEGRTAGLTYGWYDDAPDGSREMIDTDIILSTIFVTSDDSMKRTATHEWGHALGLSHSDLAGMLMSGPPESAYNGVQDVRADDIRGCRCLYGAGTQAAGFSCTLPTTLDLGRVAVGVPSPRRSITFTNNGNAPLRIASVLASSGLELAGSCTSGLTLQPGASCVAEVWVQPRIAGTATVDLALDTSDGGYRTIVRFQADSTVTPPATSVVQLIEYFNAAFGHYFLTHIADEIAKLDNGTFAGWSRTNRTINAWAQPAAGSSPVCRFFSARFAPKSSHFYTSFASECQAVKSNDNWQFEGEVFHVALPDASGACGAGTIPVYRLYNDGQSGAPNHRFTTDAALRSQMITQGWVPEGAGAGVTMCVPAGS